MANVKNAKKKIIQIRKTTLAHQQLKSTVKNAIKETGIQDLDKLVGDDNIPISSWLSAFINAHVDIVKDPYIAKLSVDKFTYNTLNLLIRSGFGDTSVWFLCQPILKEMSYAYNNAKSEYGRDTKHNNTVYDA